MSKPLSRIPPNVAPLIDGKMRHEPLRTDQPAGPKQMSGLLTII